MQWSVSILVPTVYITVSISDQHLHYVQETIPVDEGYKVPLDENGGVMMCSYMFHS